MDNLKVYKKYFETASDKEPLAMHRGHALALVKIVEQQQNEFLTLNQSLEEDDIMIGQLQEEIKQYQLQETLLLERLKKQTKEIKELRRNARTIRFFEMAEENLKLAQKIVELEGVKNHEAHGSELPEMQPIGTGD